MASPYDGLTEPELLRIKAYYLDILSGKVLQSQALPGTNYGRRIDSLADVRGELQLVIDAILGLDPDTRPITRTFIKAV